MADVKNIYAAINAIMQDVGAVGKNKRNAEQKYIYRGIDDVMTALSPAMQKHGVFVTPRIIDSRREEKEGRYSKLLYSIVTVEYTFHALDGSSVAAVVMGEGMDSGDKATNKAMSAAFKYALLQTFCIPTEELIDSEKDSPEVAKQEPQKPRTVKPPQTAQAPQEAPKAPQAVNAPAKAENAGNGPQNAQGVDYVEELKRYVVRSRMSAENITALCEHYGVAIIEDMTQEQARDFFEAVNARRMQKQAEGKA